MNTFALICVLVCVASFAFVHADFKAGCELQNVAANKAYNCTLYQQNVGSEHRIRIDVCYDGPGDDSFCESIVQRFNRTDPSGYFVSSQMIIGEPWTDFGSCCQHDALGGSSPPSLTPAVGEAFTILRSDNFTRVEIIDIQSTPADLSSITLRNWDNAAAVCKLRCITKAEVMFNIDNSGSIDTSEFTLMNEFIVAFTNSFTLSPTTTNVGIVLFGGRSGSGSSSSNDLWALPTLDTPLHGDATATLNAFNAAINSTAWYTQFTWNETIANSHYTEFTAPLNSNRGGMAWVELYMTPIKSQVLSRLATIGNGAARTSSQNTAIGTGMQLANQMFFRNPGRPVGAAGESNGYPRLLITMADGGNNRGVQVDTAATSVETTADLRLLSIGISSSVNTNEMHKAASDPSTDYFFVASFSDFDKILVPLVSRACTFQSNNAKSCSPECAAANGLCTACGTCIMCRNDDECPSCSFCSQVPYGTCIEDQSAAVASCRGATACDSVTCNSTLPRAEMCQYTYNVTSKVQAESEACLSGVNGANSVFDIGSCTCRTTISTGDGASVSVATIAASAAAGGIAILIVLAILAALLLLLLLAALFIIVAVVIAAIAMLAFGITMAIPPSISGLEVTAPTQVVNDENPLAVDGLEWVESAAQAGE